MKKRILLIAPIILLITIFIIFLINNNNYEEVEDDLISRQEKVNEDIDKYLEYGEYTIDNPKVLINPYEISPLTALLIFKTEEKQEVSIYVNNELIGTTKESKNHVIPIYYLKDNYENEIVLMSNHMGYKTIIKTDKIDNDNRLKVEKNNLNKKILLSSSTSANTYSIYNTNGDLIWNLSLASQGFISFLDNGNFLVSAEEYVTKDNISYMTSIYEMDLLGRIVKRYDLKYLYHHTFKLLDNDTLLVAGEDYSKTPMSIVYKLDLKTGKVIDYIDIDDILKDKIDTSKLNYGYGLNSVDYLNDHLLVSLRNTNQVISINYKTKEIDYIINDKNILGMHDASYYDNDINKVSLYNNNYDINSEDKTIKNKGVASALIIGINNNKITKLKEYKSENKFSYAFGSISISSEYKLVNYSYFFTDEAIKNNTSIFDYQNNTYSNLIAYDNKDKVVFKSTITDRIYKASFIKIDTYKDNYKTSKYEYYNDLNEAEETSKKFKYTNKTNFLTITKNYIKSDLSSETYKEMYIIFKGNKTYKIKYLNTDTYYKIPKGNYKIFVNIDGKYYNLNKKIKITN